MKILIITLNIYGGIIHYVSQLANSLSRNDEVIVIAPIGVERKTFKKNITIFEMEIGNDIKNFVINTLAINRSLTFLK